MRLAYSILLAGCLAGSGPWDTADAQRLELAIATAITLPADPAEGIYVGASGGMFVVTRRADDDRELRVHDGRDWRRSHVLTPTTRVLSTVGGGLLLAEGSRLATYTWNLLGPATRVNLGTLPDGMNIEAAALHTLDGLDEVPTATVATDAGVYVCAEGECEWRASSAYTLLGTDGAAVFLHGKGTIANLSDTTTSLAKAPSTKARVRPVGVTIGGTPVFRVERQLYALNRVRGRLRDVGTLPLSAEAIVVGEEVVFFEPGKRPRSISLGDPGRDPEPIPCSASARLSVRAIGGPSSAYVFGGRAVLLTRGGLTRVNPVTSTALPLALDDERAGALAVKGEVLLVDVGDAIERHRFGERGALWLETRWGNAEHYMRNSTPTCLSWEGEAVLVGTSDGRVLRLTKPSTLGTRVETVVSVVGLGTAFTDLYHDRTGTWATYSPSRRRQSGLVRITKEAAVLQLDSAGIDQPVACVRRAADGGALFASLTSGSRPLYYFYEEHDVWVALEGTLHTGVGVGLPIVREIAPVSEDLIYLATSQGVFRWRRGSGYDVVALPEGLRDVDFQSARAAGEGCWLAARGHGVFYIADDELDAVAGVSASGVKDLHARGLLSAGGDRVIVRDGRRVLSLTPPIVSRVPPAPGLLLTTRSHTTARSRASRQRAYTIRESDSLQVFYGLSGFDPEALVASFSIDGLPLRPVRDEGGVAAFAPMGEELTRLKIRVASAGGAYASSAHVQPIVSRRRWWATAVGISVIVGACLLLAGAGGAVYYVRQRRLARRLERLVAERTSELQVAERRAQRASASKSMFLANMSHEIRTPLNAVLGMSDLLLASPLSKEQAAYAEAVQRGGRSLHGIVADVLAFAEIDSGTVRRREGPVQLQELVERAAEGPRERAVAKGLQLAYHVNVPERVLADGPKIGGILAHLLDNAVKFTEAGSVALRVVGQTEERGDLLIRVTDTGIGIAPEERERIFEVFEQADNSNTRRFGGTGLGLAIVKTYVECLDGSVTVSDGEPTGSIFEVVVPIAALPAYAKTDNPANIPDANATQTPSESTDGGSTGKLASAERSTPPPEIARATRSGKFAHEGLALDNGNAVERKENTLPSIDSAGVDAANDVDPSSAETQAAASVGDLPAPTASTAQQKPKRPTFFDLAAECPLRILVAEDNAMNKMLILTVLTKLGYKADWAENGRVAVDRFGAGDYDLILMDVHMPEMDGLEATRLIRERHRERRVSICALTANASEEGRDECLCAGMDDFMTKPLQIPKLVEVLRGVTPVATNTDGELAVPSPLKPPSPQLAQVSEPR